MVRRAILVLLLAVSSALSQTDALDSALAMIGETRATFRVNPEIMITRTGGTDKLAIFDQWFADPLKIPFYERNLRDMLLDTKGRLHPLFNNCAAAIGIGTRRDLTGRTPREKFAERAKKPDALQKAILALDANASIHEPQAVPERIQQLAAMLLFAMEDAIEWRNLALRKISPLELPALFTHLSQPLERPVKDTTKTEENSPQASAAFCGDMELLEKVDLRLLAAGMDDLTAAMDSVCSALTADSSEEPFSFICSTRYGEIILSGGNAQGYGDDHTYLLILDLSGDDTYHAGGGTVDEAHPVSVIIDAAGNDTYESTDNKPCFGAGILGYGIVADLQGKDRYVTHGYMSQGCGVGGVGLLRDKDGNDFYSAR